MSWLELIRHELTPIPMFMWQYAAVLGLLALILVVTRPMRITPRQAAWMYGTVLGLTGYAISALLHIYLPPPSSAPIRYDLLFLAGMLGGWRGGVLAYVLIFGARLQWAGTVQGVYTGIDMVMVSAGGVLAHRWFATLDLAEVRVRHVLGIWGLRSLTLAVSGVVLLGLHSLPKELVQFELLPYKNSLGSLVRKLLMAGPSLLFFASAFAIFKLDAQDRRRQQQDWQSSRKDSLTHLPNRRALSEYLDHNFRDARRQHMALVHVGVGNHTQMLLAQGHGWGDRFLQRLASAVREEPLHTLLQPLDAQPFQFTDLGLVLVLNGVTAASLEHTGLAHRLHQGLGLKMREFGTAGVAPALTMTVTTCDAQRHPDAATALRELGLYMQQAEGHDPRNVQFLHTSFADAAQRELRLLASLGEWIDKGTPPLAYMPKCDLRNGHVLGAEALLRLHDEDGTLVPPGQVIALAARHKLLAAFEWSTVERVGRDAQRLARAGQPCALSVNISSASLVTVDFGLRLRELVARLGLPSEAIVLELTEYDPVPDIDAVRENTRVLNDSGIRLSLDDFGSGHSGLTVLARFPFSEVKVDHSMVALIGTPRMRSAIQLALESAQRYGATFVAEGVETQEQLLALQQLGISEGQGHLFSQALPLDALMAYARATRVGATATSNAPALAGLQGRPPMGNAFAV